MIKEGGAAKEHVWWWYGWYSRELEQEDGHGEIVFTAAITISFIILRSTCRYPPSFYNKRSHGGFGGMGRFGASPAYQSQCHPLDLTIQAITALMTETMKVLMAEEATVVL